MGKKKNVINNEKNKNTVALKKEIKQNINNLEESNEIELKEENIKKEVQKGCNCKKDKTSANNRLSSCWDCDEIFFGCE